MNLILKILRSLFRPNAFAFNDAAPGARSGGIKTYRAGAALPALYQLVTLSSGKIVTATENGVAIGVALSAANAADVTNETPIGVAIFGAAPGTLHAPCKAAVNALDPLVVADDGELKKLPSANGTYYVIGIALHGADAGESLEFAHCCPQKVVIAG